MALDLEHVMTIRYGRGTSVPYYGTFRRGGL